MRPPCNDNMSKKGDDAHGITTEEHPEQHHQ